MSGDLIDSFRHFKAQSVKDETPAVVSGQRKRKVPATDARAVAVHSAAPLAALSSLSPAFVARFPGLWRERYASACDACFASAVPCVHHRERPLRLLLIGHNPSTHAWASGYPYSNPSNRFWKLMRGAGLVPPDFLPHHADTAPELLGLGITDVGCVPGSDAATFKRAEMLAWRADLYERLRAHLARCAAWGAAEHACAPRVVAFTGKRQWASLFQPPLSGFAHGVQACRPPGWPLPKETEVWVLPSSSGRAVMSAQEREGPYMELGKRVLALPWPRSEEQCDA